MLNNRRRKTLLVVASAFLVTVTYMFIYEMLKDFFFPSFSKYESHIVTIAFVSLTNTAMIAVGYWRFLKLERQIQSVQKLESLGLMAGGIAHDFNNLLTGVIGNADLALAELGPRAKASAYLGVIKDLGKRLTELARAMLDYTGRGRFEARPVDLTRLVREMTPLIEASLPKRVKLAYSLPDDLPSIHGDSVQLAQVLMNLLINAAEAIPGPDGLVQVSTGTMQADRRFLAKHVVGNRLREGCYVLLEVTDNGCGMDEQTQEKIFDPFYSTKFTGRGLGLAAVLGIVKRHQGAIGVSSKKGRGSTFRVLLPCDESERTVQEVEPISGPAGQRSGIVLVVDDEECVRVMAATMLEKAGFEVLVAADGAEAIDLLKRHTEPVLIALVDLTMPGKDGVQLSSEIRQIRPGVRIILSSGYQEAEVMGCLPGLSIDGFLQKPYSFKELQQKISIVLGR